MSGNQLTELMNRECDELDATSAQRILAGAVNGGARRRRDRRLALGASAAAVVGVLTLGTSLAMAGGTATNDRQSNQPAVAPSPSAPKTSATYDPGSGTEVPDGPRVDTDRRVAGDSVLLSNLRQVLPPDGVVAGLGVKHIESSNPFHQADKTRNGRRISFTYDNAAASVTVQRWDGYAAVGIKPLRGKGGLGKPLESDLEQRAATTAREACAGSYQVYPPIECQETEQGWYSVARPSQGDSVSDSLQELLVSLYTHDGYVVHVDSYNSPGEKVGPIVADAPVLTIAESLTMATSARWFVAK